MEFTMAMETAGDRLTVYGLLWYCI